MTNLQMEIFREIQGCCISDKSAKRASEKATALFKAEIQSIYEMANAVPLSSRQAQFQNIVDELKELIKEYYQ